MIDFAEQSWFAIKREIAPLWANHWQEIGEDRERIPLDPDFEGYDRLASAGRLVIVTGRCGPNLVAYAFCLIGPHLHYRSTMFANMDLYYIVPAHRGGRTAVRLFGEMERVLRARGVIKIVGNTKLAHDQGRLFQHLGYREAERIFVKVI